MNFGLVQNQTVGTRWCSFNSEDTCSLLTKYQDVVVLCGAR
jgi:hypothetical protein